MNKVLKFSLLSIVSSFLLVGCSNTPDTSHMSSTEIREAASHKNLTQKKLAKIVKSAGEKAGWKMTEFKGDAFVAEKTEDDETISTTVKFNNEAIEVEPENDDLKDAINEALENI